MEDKKIGKVRITIEGPDGREPVYRDCDAAIGTMVDFDKKENATGYFVYSTKPDPWSLGGCYIESAVNVICKGKAFNDDELQNFEDALKFLAGVGIFADRARKRISKKVEELEELKELEEPEDE